MAGEHTAFIQRWMEEVWNKGRVDVLEQMMSSDCTVFDDMNVPLRGREAFKEFHRNYREAFPDLKLTVHDVISEPDRAAIRFTAAGTHRGNTLGFPATGKQARVTGMFFARITNGRIVESWNNFDRFGMLQQLGVLSLPT